MTTPLIALLALFAPPQTQAAEPLLTWATGMQPTVANPANAVPAPVGLTVDAKDGDSLTGTRTFKVTVQTDEVVTQVEFYVNGELRGTEQSTPYKFELDTLNENDGPIAIKFIAYTDQTHKGTKELKLNVDNGVSQGADVHVKKGYGFLRDAKYDAAITEGRIALKADKKSAAARLLLARSYLFEGVLDKAQKYAEDVTSDDPKNLEALQVASVIGLKQAFNTSAKNPDDSSTLDTIKTAFKNAVDARRTYLDAAVDAMGTVTPANAVQVAEANIRAGHYTTAIGILSPLFAKDTSKADIANRLTYAQIRRGRFQDAQSTLDLLKKANPTNSDPYSLALTALVDAQLGDNTAADAAMQDALLSDINDLGVRTAQASIALRNVTTAGEQKNYTSLQNMVTSLSKDAGNRTEVNYFLSALSNRLEHYSDARKYFEVAVLEEPSNYDMYIEEGNASISLAQSMNKFDKKHHLIPDADRDKRQAFQYRQAEAMFATALVAKPDSYQALSGLALAYLFEGKPVEALKYAKAAAGTEPTYAAGLYVLSAALSANGQDDAGKTVTVNAWKYDKELDGRPIPSPSEAWRYFNSRGRSPVITPPGR
jgi:Tfp pilus assembly protein PilF